MAKRPCRRTWPAPLKAFSIAPETQGRLGKFRRARTVFGRGRFQAISPLTRAQALNGGRPNRCGFLMKPSSLNLI
jgi:hypothetical protein